MQFLGVRARDVWDDSSVVDKHERLSHARAKGENLHMADVMAIASIKFWGGLQKRKYKAQIVFRGGKVKDSDGEAARFGEMYSTPTNIQSKSSLRAALLSEEDTYIALPPELWLDSWKGRCKQPTVRLKKALYRHHHLPCIGICT